MINFAIALGVVVLIIFLATFVYIFWYAENRLDTSDYEDSNVFYRSSSLGEKPPGSGHGYHTPYGGASSNGAASGYAARNRAANRKK